MENSSQSRGNFQNALQTLGLNQKESDVYFSLLTMGAGTVSEIAKKSHINRTTAYDILGSLSSKGLIVISGKEPKQEYRCEDPKKLLDYLRKDIEKKEENFRYAEVLLPELKSIYKVGSRPQVKFYEGVQGLEDVYEDTLTANEPIRAYANVDEMHKALPNYFPKYYKRRAGKGIAIRAIIPKNEAGEERARQDKYELRQSAFVSPEEYYFSPEINIYDNKVMIASWREKLGIIIESAEIADAMKKIYELAWAGAKQTRTNPD